MKWVLGGVGAVVAAGVIAFAAFGGGAIAQADGNGSNQPSAYETALAQQLGISVDQLQAAQTSAFNSAVDGAETAGKINADQAAKLKAAGANGHPRLGMLRRAAGRVKAGIGHVIDSAASTIGISKDEVKSGLQNGQSLAQIAAAHNVTADQLKTGISTSVNAQLEDAVKAGKITQPQADKVMSTLNSHLDKLINRTKGMKAAQ